jgi:hypothetical protein
MSSIVSTGSGWLRSIINGDDVGLRLVLLGTFPYTLFAQPQVAEVRAYSAQSHVGRLRLSEYASEIQWQTR